MLVTTDRVKELTGKVVTPEIVSQAQGLIEAYATRSEAEIVSARDRELMSKATAYQAAYMQDNPDIVFEQIAVSMVQPAEGMVAFDRPAGSPFLSPHVLPLLKYLSWRNSRSVKVSSLYNTGSIHGLNQYAPDVWNVR